MAKLNLSDITTPRAGLLAGAATVTLAGLIAASSTPAATPAAAPCKWAAPSKMDVDTGVEPELLINGTCIDPVYNDATFIVDKTEQLTYQIPGGALVPYTQVTGHWPATRTPDTLPPNVRQSPTTFEQKYVIKFPAKQFWQHRTMLQQHPTGGGMVDPRMAFGNGAITISWQSNSVPNAVNSHRHQAAATKWADAYARKLYGDNSKIYNYFWGCSGGGVVSMAAAENTSGVWDGVQVQCMGPVGIGNYHSFFWAALYTLAIPRDKDNAIALAAVPGGTGDIYAGLNDEEKSVLNEFVAAGYPLPLIGNHGRNFVPTVDPIDIRMADPTYDEDFWTKPGYQGVNPPNYLKAAITDGWATVTAIDRDAAGNPTVIHFDPATFPKLGPIGDSYLEYWVYSPDGKTRLIDPTRATGVPTLNKRRFSLLGVTDAAKAQLTVTGNLTQGLERGTPITNSPMLLGAVKVGSKVRVNNRFILSIYYYPRYSNIPGARSFDQYRNADGSSRYPQRKDLSALAYGQYRTMGSRVESGAVQTRTMVIEGRGDTASWPIFNASYYQMILRSAGSKADSTVRFYLHDNGRHGVGGGEPGIFQQSMQDMIAWVEKGIAPPPSTAFTIRNGQVTPPDSAAERHGLQPVMSFTANGVSRATVAVNQPVDLAGRLEMPPKTGMIVQYGWSMVDANAAPPPAPAAPAGGRGGGAGGRGPAAGGPSAGPPTEYTVLDKPQTLVNVNRSIKFDKPGTYIVRLTVNGQRDGLVNPANQTLMQNWKEIRVVVQ